MLWDKMQIGDACVYKNGLYFFDNWSQSIMYLDFPTNTVKIKKMYKGTYFLANRIFIYDDNLYIFAGNSYRIINYNIATDKYEEIVGMDKEKSIYTIIQHGSKAWYIPKNLSEEIMVFDIEDCRFYTDMNYTSIFKGCEKDTCSYPTVSGTIIWQSLAYSNRIIGYDIISHKIYEKSSPANIRLSTSYVYNNDMYITQVDSGDVIIAKDTKIVTVKAASGQKEAYSFIYKFDDKLWFLPRYGKEILVYDLRKEEANRIGYPNNITDMYSPSAAIGCVSVHGKMIILPWRVGAIYVVAAGSNIAEKLEVNISPEDYCRIMYRRKDLIKETDDVGINDFLNSLLQDESVLPEQECLEEKDTVGNIIWNRLR